MCFTYMQIRQDISIIFTELILNALYTQYINVHQQYNNINNKKS